MKIRFSFRQLAARSQSLGRQGVGPSAVTEKLRRSGRPKHGSNRQARPRFMAGGSEPLSPGRRYGYRSAPMDQTETAKSELFDLRFGAVRNTQWIRGSCAAYRHRPCGTNWHLLAPPEKKGRER